MRSLRALALAATLALLAGLLPACADGDGPEPPTAATAEPLTGEIPWWNERVFYEVFVRSFADSDADGNGDLPGLISRLDYLNDGDPSTTDDLGITGLWLMPVSQSPSYHGYDTTDHYEVESDYGTNADYRTLVTEAHRRGIAVIVDLMLNHTSSEHPWFLDSASSPQAVKRDWYVWSDTDPGDTSPWSGAPLWNPRNGAYYYALFWAGMPDLNYRNDEVTDQMYDVAGFWLEDMGADGFRLDAVRHLVEAGGRVEGTQETHAWLVAWDDHLDSLDPQALTVGEVWDRSTVAAGYVTGGEVDLTFDFGLAEAILTSVRSGAPDTFAAALADTLAAYPPGQFAPFLTNHDQDRVMSQLAGDAPSAKLAAATLLTLPGVPFLYYGEEIGMTGQKPDERIRTPMAWTSGPHGGFTTGTPWEPLDDDPGAVNVEAQDDDPDSLLSHYRRLIGLRADHPALQIGGLQSLSTCPGSYAHLRTSAGAEPGAPILTLLNFLRDPLPDCAVSSTSTSLPPGSYTATDLLTGRPAAELTVGESGSISGYTPLGLAAQQALVLALAPTP